MSIEQFLTWISSSGGAAVAMSFIAERIPAFQRLPSDTKSLYILIGSIALALISYAVLTYTPKDILAQLAPFFAIIYGIVSTWIASQISHKLDPQRDTNRAAEQHTP